MRALLTAMRCGKGDLAGNLARHLTLVSTAEASGCALAVFPEMSLTGSGRAAVSLEGPEVRAVAAATAGGVAAVFGVIEAHPGGARSITSVVATGGHVVATQRKRHLGEGEEEFVEWPDRAPALAVVAAGGARSVSMGVAICAEADVDFPFDDAARTGARLLCFVAAPGLYGRRASESGWRAGFGWWRDKCLDQLPAHARRTGCPILVSTQAGATVDEDFPGWAALVGSDGTIAAELPDWREATLVVDVDLDVPREPIAP